MGRVLEGRCHILRFTTDIYTEAIGRERWIEERGQRMREELVFDLVKYSQELHRFVRAILKNDDDAEDIMVELFLKVYATEPELLPTKNQQAWLRVVARNLALNKLKRDSYCSPIEWVDDLPDPLPFEERVLGKIDYEIALSRLEETKRRIIEEKIGGLRTHKEIALLLDLPQGTVRRQYREALAQLRHPPA